MDDINLFPRPRTLTVHPGSRLDVGTLDVQRHLDPSLPREAFTLEVRPDAVTIRHADDAGARYAEAARAQLAGHADGVPPLDVADEPDLAVRGYMLDVARDRVPTRESLDRLVDLLALARYNQLQLYMEHTFAYRDHETVWRDASPLTPDDVRWLDARCAAAGIELVPNQNVFGHMGRWLAHDEYRDRAETPDGFEVFDGVVLPPTVLEPTEENARFALDLLHELLDCFTSRRVHIGCDEAMELGRGASRARAEATSRGRVFLEHVLRIATPLLADGYEVQVWDDMLRHEPALVRELPDGVVPVPWTYEEAGAPNAQPLPPWYEDVMARLGYAEGDLTDGFVHLVGRYGDLDRPFVLAPGTSTWNSLVGRVDNAYANIADATSTGLARGAAGVLVTDWGDNGHLQPPAVSLPGIVFGGALAWCADTNRDADVATVIDDLVLTDATRPLGRVLDRLGRAWTRTGLHALNGSPLEAALVPTAMFFTTGDPDADELRAVVDDLDEMLADIAASGSHVALELTAATRLARHGAYRLLARAGGPAPDERDLREAIELQREAWLAVSRPGGFADSIGLLESQLA
jgi:hypothetical protein